MRTRITVLASLLAAVAMAVVPSVASAAPHHNRGLTINVTPNPILAGEGVLIYGQLNTAPVAGQKIVLFHHISGSHSGYTRIGATTTNTQGFYEFTRAEGVVDTNRSWFVREDGVHTIHSRTVHERVAALVSVAANETTADTNHPVLFTGHVTPNHRFERVLLQEQNGVNGNQWKTVDSGRIGPGSNYSIAHRFRVPGQYDLRVAFSGDTRNTAGASDTVTVSIEQAQVPGFTINASPANIIPDGSELTVSGVLDQHGTSLPEPATAVTLWAHQANQAYRAIATTTTGTDGSYSVSLTGGMAPAHNEIYQVRTSLAPHRHSAQLFEGVQDVVTFTPSSLTSTVGGQVSFTGSVTPTKAGHAIYLQRLGADGKWHTVQTGLIAPSSNYSFTWTFGTAGSKQFRVRVPGGPENVGVASAPVTITVTLPPVSSLPPAS